jgi:hypothetical protein
LLDELSANPITSLAIAPKQEVAKA